MNLPNNLKLPGRKKKSPYFALILFGIVLIVFGIIMLSFKTDDFVKTVGRITAVSEVITTDPDEPKQYDVDFTYTVKGEVKHDVKRGTFSNLTGDFKEGDDIDVYYDPEKPDVYTNAKTSKIVPPIIIGVGGVVTAIGVFKLIRKFM